MYGIFTYMWLMFMVFVEVNIPYMDPMGNINLSTKPVSTPIERHRFPQLDVGPRSLLKVVVASDTWRGVALRGRGNNSSNKKTCSEVTYSFAIFMYHNGTVVVCL